MTRHALASCCLAAALILLAASAARAADTAKGDLVIGGKKMPITHVYAYAQKGFFNPKTQDVVVLLCDAEVSPKGVRDMWERRDLVKANKLHCVQLTIDAKKQVINFRVEDGHFGMPETGGSTEQLFESTTFDGKTIAGKAYTRSEQKSFDDIPYSYEIHFSAAIAPMK